MSRPTTASIQNRLSASAFGDALVQPWFARVSRMKRSVITSARLHEEALDPRVRYRKLFLTFTYRQVGDWEPNQLRDCLSAIRTFLARRGVEFRYVWVAELQKRGAVHYHLILWLPAWLHLPYVDRHGWWKHGSTNVQRARNPVGYIAKYASKGQDSGFFPCGLRLSGCGGLPADSRRQRRFWMAPKYVRDSFSLETVDLIKVPGGFVDRFSATFCQSPWEFWGFLKTALGRFPFFLQVREGPVLFSCAS